MKAPKFEKNAKYSFYEDDYTLYEFIEETEDGAKFVEYRLEPSDGSLEKIGEITFDAYQVTRLNRVCWDEKAEGNEMKISYNVYEDNGGGIHMIVSADDELHVFTGLEYNSEPGIVIDMINQLKENPNAWKMWDGWEGDVPEADVISWIQENDDEIAWGENGTVEMVDFFDMGYAGRHALAISEPEDE